MTIVIMCHELTVELGTEVTFVNKTFMFSYNMILFVLRRFELYGYIMDLISTKEMI